MATITFTLEDTCTGGGHAKVGVSVDGGAKVILHLMTDEILESLTNQERAIALLRTKLGGKTRAQAVATFPFAVVI